MPRKSSSSFGFDSKSNLSSFVSGTLTRIGSLRRSFRKSKPSYTSKYDQQNLRYLDISTPVQNRHEPDFHPARIYPAKPASQQTFPFGHDGTEQINEINIDEAFDYNQRLRSKTEEIYGIIQPKAGNMTTGGSTIVVPNGTITNGVSTYHEGFVVPNPPSPITFPRNGLYEAGQHRATSSKTPSVISTEYSTSTDLYETVSRPLNNHNSTLSRQNRTRLTSSPSIGQSSGATMTPSTATNTAHDLTPELNSELSDTNSLLSSELSFFSQSRDTTVVQSNDKSAILQHLQSKYPQYDIVTSDQSRSSKSKSSKVDSQTLPNQQASSSSRSSNGPSSGNAGGISSTGMPNSAQTTARSASTTPMDRNFYAFQGVHHVPASALFDEDPGIMSEIETSATGFRRGGKIRSSLPVVRTPSKSQDQSLGLVFLQFRSETKRALLPNEITSLDTVKALFVRSFPRQLSMNYLEHPSVRVYIHDAGKDMFYELEDLRDVKDRAILRIYEKGVAGPQPGEGASVSQLNIAPLGSGPGPMDPNALSGPDSFGYFSEPEFDSDFQSQHIHRKRPFPLPVGAGGFPHPVSASGGGLPQLGGAPQSSYYGTIMVPPQFRHQLGLRPGLVPVGAGSGPPVPPARGKAFPGYSQTLPRGTHLMSPTSALGANGPINHFAIASQQAPPKPQRSFVGQNPTGIYVIQRPLGPAPPPGSMPAPVPSPGPQPYGGQRPLPDRPYSVTGNYPSPDRLGRATLGHNGMLPGNALAGSAYPQHDISGYLSSPEHRPAGLLTNMPQQRASFSAYPTGPRFEDVAFQPINVYANRLGQGPPPQLPPAAHNAAVESFRMQEMERQIASLTNVVNKALTGPQSKPLPPPKPASLMPGYRTDHVPMSSDDCLKSLKSQTSELRNEIKNLKKTTQHYKSQTNEFMQDGLKKINDSLEYITNTSDSVLRMERCKVSHDRDAYTDDLTKLDKDLAELESQVEELRSNVINRRCRVNVSNVESMAHVLARASKTVADLKIRYPTLAKEMKSIMGRELQHIEREEKFLKEEPDRLEHSLKRCKKLTGTLVTLKRLASVQEQRSSTNPSTCSPSQLRDGSGDEMSSSGPRSTHDPLTRADKKRAVWRRSVHFHRPLSNKHKIEYALEPMVFSKTKSMTNYRLCRGFTSMPTIQDDVDIDMMGGRDQQIEQPPPAQQPPPASEDNYVDKATEHQYKFALNQRSTSVGRSFPATPTINSIRNRLGRSKSSAAELMEPHTVIQVTPATPSSTDSSKTATILENLFDELQSFSKQSSIDSSLPPLQRSSGSLRGKHNTNIGSSDSLRKASRSKSYSSLRANSESPNARNRGSSLADGTIDLESIALLASKCGQSAAATAALVEKRFAQSRQELLEQRHQELLRKQRQLQEQYTRLQQLSRGQINRQLGELKKTGSESNLRMMDAAVGVPLSASGKSSRISSASVHGSLKNLAKNTDQNYAKMNAQSAHHRVGDSNPEPIPKKVYETDIL